MADNEVKTEDIVGEESSPQESQTQGAGSASEAPMPAPTFSTFILSLASSALVHLGEVAEPSTGKFDEQLLMAEHTIDLLSMLEEKIKNGLDEDEQRLLSGILYELRMKFVVKKK